MKTNRSPSHTHDRKSSRAGAMFMNKRAPEPAPGHFYDGSAAVTYARWR